MCFYILCRCHGNNYSDKFNVHIQMHNIYNVTTVVFAWSKVLMCDMHRVPWGFVRSKGLMHRVPWGIAWSKVLIRRVHWGLRDQKCWSLGALGLTWSKGLMHRVPWGLSDQKRWYLGYLGGIAWSKVLIIRCLRGVAFYAVLYMNMWK